MNDTKKGRDATTRTPSFPRIPPPIRVVLQLAAFFTWSIFLLQILVFDVIGKESLIDDRNPYTGAGESLIVKLVDSQPRIHAEIHDEGGVNQAMWNENGSRILTAN